VISLPAEEDKQRTTFNTVFSKPNLFRFEFASPHPYKPLAHAVSTTICGFDGRSAYLWTKSYDQVARIEECESILMAVAGATGISSGSATNIAQLLFPDIGVEAFAALTDISWGDGEQVEENDCVEVRARLRDADVEMCLFIDEKQLLVRKFVTRFDSFSSQDVRTNIRINHSVATKRFNRPGNET
jgi:hypothetical protein